MISPPSPKCNIKRHYYSSFGAFIVKGGKFDVDIGIGAQRANFSKDQIVLPRTTPINLVVKIKFLYLLFPHKLPTFKDIYYMFFFISI